jgi:colanic acid biosynthesis glycosyl transferase WcaI
VGKYTGEMAVWLASQGHQVRVVTAPPHYPQYRVFEGYSRNRFTRDKHVPALGVPCSVEVFRCPIWIPREPRGWKRILHLVSFAITSFFVMILQLRWKPDVVLLLGPTILCAPAALSVARLLGATSWFHVQDFEVDAAFYLNDFSSTQLRRWVLALERFVLSKFDRVSAISERMVERLTSKGVNPTRAVLFPNWVDTTAIYPMSGFSPLRKELGIPPEAVVALYAGSMGKKQGLELLVEASRRLAASPCIQFVFCGDGSYRETFKRMTKDFRNVILLTLQPIERLNHLLNLADIHLLPQLAHAADLVMPSKLTGMMASGRAVLATAAPGTQLFRAVQGRGMVTPPGDVDALVSALVELAGDSRLRKRMGEEARKYAAAFLNRDEILSHFEASLLESCGVSPNYLQREVIAVPSSKSGDD